jgi:hypothetical protein
MYIYKRMLLFMNTPKSKIAGKNEKLLMTIIYFHRFPQIIMVFVISKTTYFDS